MNTYCNRFCSYMYYHVEPKICFNLQKTNLNFIAKLSPAQSHPPLPGNLFHTYLAAQLKPNP